MKKALLLSAILLFNTAILLANGYYWVGGSGNWSDHANHWATSSGGSTFHTQPPGNSDNVYFDANSFPESGATVTIDVDAICSDMDWSGVINNPTLAGATNRRIDIYGSLTLHEDMVYNFLGDVHFRSFPSGRTIIMAGQTFKRHVYFNGFGGWILQDELTITGNFNIYLVEGSLNTNDQPVNASRFLSNYTNNRSLLLGTSTISLAISSTSSSGRAFDINGTNLDLNAGTSTIIFTGENAVFYNHSGGGQTFHNIVFDGSGTQYLDATNGTFHNVIFNGNGFIRYGNTINDVTFMGNGNIQHNNTFGTITLSAGKSYTFSNSTTQTINGNLLAEGNCAAPITLQSNSTGSQINFIMESGSMIVDYCILSDIHASGGASFTANNSIDLGNNSGWVIHSPTALNLYWVGGSGNWNDANNWALSSGGAGGTCIPSPIDNVFFDSNSFSETGQTVTLIGNEDNRVFCRHMNWTGATNMPTLDGASSQSLNIYGSLILNANMTYNFQGPIYFRATSAGNNILSSGNVLDKNHLYFHGEGGEWTLSDDLNIGTRNLYFVRGTLNTNDHPVSADRFLSNYTNNRTLILGNSTFYLSMSNTSWNARAFEINGTNLELDAGASTFRLTGANTRFYNVTGGGQTFHDVVFEGSGTQQLEASNGTFNNVTFNGNGSVHHGKTISNLTFNGNGTLNENNTIGTLTFTPGNQYTLQHSRTQTILDDLQAEGTETDFIIIRSNSTGNRATISKESGTVNVEYITLQDNLATGGATFVANNSFDMGNNEGWEINLPDGKDFYWVGGTGNWNNAENWALTTGGDGGAGIPTQIDNAIFDQNSFSELNQTVTLTGDAANNINCFDMDWTEATNYPTLAGASNQNLRIYGSLALTADMIYTFAGPVFFEATDEGHTISTAGVAMNNNHMYLQGEGGGWTLSDGLNIGNRILYFVRGTLNTNDQPVSADRFLSNYTNNRTLILGNSTFYLSMSNTSWNARAFEINGTNLELDAGASTFRLTGANTRFYNVTGGGQTFHDVVFEGSGTQHLEASNGTFNNVTFNGNGSVHHGKTISNLTFNGNGTLNENNTIGTLTFTPGNQYTLQHSRTQTILDDLQAEGTETDFIIIRSNSIGNRATFSKESGTVNVDYVTLQDNLATGGATFVANNSFDMGNNEGWEINLPDGKDFYWVGGTGNWNDAENWALTTGGDGGAGIPTQIDNAIFDQNSFSELNQIVTLTGDAANNINCFDMDWTEATNYPTLAGASNQNLRIYGSLALTADMIYTFAGPVFFEATDEGHTISTAGVAMNNNHMYLQGEGGGWTLSDGLNIGNRILYFVRGTLNTNNQPVSADRFLSNYTNNRTLILGNSTFYLSMSNTSWNARAFEINGTNLELDAGASTFRLTGANTRFYNVTGGGQTFHDVVFEGSGTQQLEASNGTFNNVTFNGNGSVHHGKTISNLTFNGNGTLNENNTIGTLTFTPGNQYTLQHSRTQTILDDLQAEGTETDFIIIRSSSAGNQATISKESGTVTVEHVTLQDNLATGGATFVANNSFDMGNNEGWEINLPGGKEFYWVGGTGNWNDAENWALTSGGEGGTGIPTQIDNVIFDQNSFTELNQVVTLIGDAASNINCFDMDWTEATNYPTLAGASNQNLRIYGSLALTADMIYTFAGPVSFEATDEGHTISTAGVAMNNNWMSFQGEGGEWTLSDGLNIGTRILYFVRGTLNTNNQPVSADRFLSNYTNNRTLILGTSTFYLSMSNTSWNARAFEINGTNLDLDAGASTFRLTGANTRFYNVTGGGQTFHDVVFEGSGTQHLEASNGTFNSVTFNGNGLVHRGKTISNLTFNGNGTLNENNTIGTLTFTPGNQYTLQHSRTQTILNDFLFWGSPSKPIQLHSSHATIQATISKTMGLVAGNHILLRGINAEGGATYLVYNSEDLGNNTGWNFSEPDDATCPGDMSVCYNAEPFVLNMALPSGGSYQGTGVYFDDLLEAYMFDASLVTADTTIVNYQVFDPNPGICDFMISIIPPPTVECIEDIEVCAGSDFIALFEGDGVYSYNGQPITGFNPVTAGTYVITYTETNECGSADCTFEIVVLPGPDLVCTENLYFYETHPLVDLTDYVSPDGGTFSGEHLITDGGYWFDPSVGLGQYGFEYCASLGDCESCCQITVHVVEPISIMATANPEIACVGAPVQLSAAVTGGSGSYEYIWTSEPAGFHSNLQNPIAHPEENTVYHVYVFDGFNSETASTSVETWFSDAPNAPENLLPPDSTFTVQQPVEFTWDATDNTTHYNLFIWRSIQQKPALPTVPNIETNSYTYNDYLNTGYIYNWQVVAVNPCHKTPSEVHTFAFNLFPDLIVSEIITPETALSGSEMDLSFTITNVGEGETGWTPWIDRVYLSEHTEFNPASAILAGSFPNKAYLASGESYTNEVKITPPHYLEGQYYVFVYADATNTVPETNDDNNILRSDDPTEISMPPYPDIAVGNIESLSGNIVPGENLTVGWTVENVGDADAIGGWSQRIAIVSGSRRHILGHTQNTETIEVSGSIQQSASFVVHTHPGMEGDVYLEVRLTPNPQLVEKPNATENNTALSAEAVHMEKRLTIALPKSTIDEDATTPMNATVFRSGNRSQALVVHLDVSEEGRLNLPATITIGANQAGRTFAISAIDNDLIEGDIDVDITASANDYPDAVATLTIIDDDLPGLQLSLSADEAWEGDTVQLTVTREYQTNNDATVTFFTSRPNQIALPQAVVIPAGETSVTTDVAVIDDNIPELTENVVIEAAAPGFDPATVVITIYDDDIPELTLTLNPATVAENGGPYASWGKVQIPEPANGNLRIMLSVNTPGQVYFPNMVTIPNGMLEQQFNIGIIDNNIVDGDRTIEITAAVYIPSCGCGAPEETGGTDTCELTILDDDGPALSVSSQPFVVPENIPNAGVLTISRNTPGGDEVMVNIQHNGEVVLDLPETAIIPAGENSVTVPFNTLDDGVEAGDHIVTVIVSAADYSSGSCWIMITERNLPDYVVTGLNLSHEDIFINEQLDISVEIANEGFAMAAPNAEVKIYLTKETKIDNTSQLIAVKNTPTALQVGQSVTVEASFTPTLAVGDYYVMATVNANNALNELVFINNTSQAVPVTIMPDYSATAMVSENIYNGTTPITITGYTEAIGKGRVPHKDVDVYVVVNGVRRVLQTTSDDNGDFSVDFIPVNGEAGEYYVGACFPGQGLNDADDDFIIMGASHTASGFIKWDMWLDETKQFYLEVKNNSPINLHNVSLEILSAPPGCVVNVTPIGTLPGKAYGSLAFTVTSSSITPGNQYEEVKLQLTSDEGTRFRFSTWLYTQATKGNMKITPVVLNQTMLQNATNYAEFEVRNNGMDETGEMTLMLPDVYWMSVLGSNTIASLQPGSSAVVTLKLTPGSDLQLNNPISGNLVLNATNANAVSVPFVFEPVSNATGDLLVDVVDEYTYNTVEAPHVEGATVVVSHPYTGQIIAQGLTNSDGHFLAEGLNEGFYNLRVSAPQHSTYQNTIYITKGVLNSQLVFIDFQAISYSWNVVPTMIPDQYEIDLIVVFETNVPAPVVVMNMPDTMPHLNHGEVFPFILTLTNYGLITAKDVEIAFPDDEEYKFTANVNTFDLLPNTSIQVPVIMERKTGSKGSDKSSLVCVDVVLASYKFECGPDDRMRLVADNIYYEGRVCYTVSSGGFGSGWGFGPGIGPGGGVGGYVPPPKVSTTPLEFTNVGCDPCLALMLNALWGCLPIPDAVDIALSVSGLPALAAIKGVWGKVTCAWNVGWAIGCKINDLMGWANVRSSLLNEYIELQEDFYAADQAFQAIDNIVHEVYNDDSLINRQDFLSFNDSVFVNIESLTPISLARQTELLNAFGNSDISPEEMNGFFVRWNETMEAWNSKTYSPTDAYPNIIDQIKIDDYSLSLDSALTYAQDKGWNSIDELFNAAHEHASSKTDNLSESICATVTIQFSQTLTMTREAFEGTLTLFNGHEGLPMENIMLDLEIRDEDGVLRNNLFEITTKSLDQISEINGSGSLQPQMEGSAVVLFIPERGAAPDVPRYYSFGGKLSYLDPFTGELVEQVLYPVTLQVNPSPNLYINYFMQRDILGNDPLTDVIEPSIPAELAVMIENRGAGTAHSVNIESAQPVIIDNEKGLLIDFNIVGSNLGGQPTQLGLLNVDFGHIPGGEIAVGQWWFTSSLLGHFISYEVHVNHLNSFGNPELSLIGGVQIHELIKSVYVYGEHDDGINDFLVNDIPDSEDYPDALYYSNGIVAEVFVAESSETDGPVNMNNLSIQLTVEPSEIGWNYTRLDDPGNGMFRIVSCTREDGQEIPLDNIWLRHVRLPDGGEPIYENMMHFIDIFDSLDPVNYTVVFEPVAQDIPEVVAINGIPEGIIDTPLSSVQVVFNKPIDPESFNHEDMELRNQGGANLMDEMVTVTQISETVFEVDISAKTGLNGFYTLTVHTIGIADLIGNFGEIGKQVSWIQALSVPAIERFFGHPAGPGDAIDALYVYFNMPVDEATFTNQQVVLHKLSGDELASENLIITKMSANSRLFRISELLPLNLEGGTYELTVKVTEILGESGHYGLMDQSVQWTISDDYTLIVNAGSDAAICEGSMFSLTEAETNAPISVWTGGDGYFEESYETVLYYPGELDIAAGQLDLCITAMTTGGTAILTDCMTLTINPLPEVTCPDDMFIQFDELPLALAGATPEGGFYSGADVENNVFNPQGTNIFGFRSVYYNFTNEFGCTNQCSFTIRIDTVPPVYLNNIVVSAGEEHCHGSETTILTENYVVEPGGSVTLASAINIMMQPGTHIQQGAYLHAFIDSEAASFCDQPKSMLAADRKDEPTGGETTQTELNLPDRINKKADFIVYPNPTTGFFTLELMGGEQVEAGVAEVYNLMGERITRKNLAGKHRWLFDMADQPNGVYIIRVVYEDGMHAWRLIKR